MERAGPVVLWLRARRLLPDIPVAAPTLSLSDLSQRVYLSSVCVPLED